MEELCSICHCTYRDSCVRQPSCKHVFHRSCLDKWEEVSNECPVCRQPLKNMETALTKTFDDCFHHLNDLIKCFNKMAKFEKSMLINHLSAKDLVQKMTETEDAYSKIASSLTDSFIHETAPQLPQLPSLSPLSSFLTSTTTDLIDSSLPSSTEISRLLSELQNDLAHHLGMLD
jgi:hypothetical protein